MPPVVLFCTVRNNILLFLRMFTELTNSQGYFGEEISKKTLNLLEKSPHGGRRQYVGYVK